ncbi:MAG TPA: PIG-L deacetylase family protein [Gaiellaceae bacterium]|jgi:LmbE family N-acetylglucosaminyl deacetylase
MLKLELASGSGRLLAVGAHSDDLEIGCGGTILRLVAEQAISEVKWVVLSGGEERAREAEASARAFLEGVPQADVVVRGFRDGFFPYVGSEVKEFFETLKAFRPDLVFVPRRDDLHQDHRLVGELAWNTFRDDLILEYEIPKYDGDLRSPNVFFELPEATCRQKVKAIVEGFASQAHRSWFTEEVFWSLLRLRGFESCSQSGYAEGFHCRKVVI